MTISSVFIRRPRLGEVTLADGDKVELVHFVGGG